MSKLVRHRAIYTALRWILSPFLIIAFRFKGERVNEDFPAVVLSNHNTDWDPLLMATAMPKQMYFVASEHMFRWGVVSSIIKFLVDPIPRLKGASAESTKAEVRRRVGMGANVVIFAEGNRSWNGETGFISPNTGKLVKDAGGGLITYRLSGGYLLSPRWAKNRRKGPLFGKVAGIYRPERIAEMSVDEINCSIAADLYENAFETQRQRMSRYRAKDRAEQLECALYICPCCKDMNTLRSKGDRLFCEKCGYSLIYDEYGFFQGEDICFDNILDWDKWQRAELLNRLKGDGPFFSSREERLSLVHPGKDSMLLCEGKLFAYADRLELCGDSVHSFEYDDIAGMSAHGRNALTFSLRGGGYYEIKSPLPRALTVYIIIYMHFTGKEYV